MTYEDPHAGPWWSTATTARQADYSRGVADSTVADVEVAGQISMRIQQSIIDAKADSKNY
jgi:hypothetical protein